MEISETIIICAVRYALGRMSYVVGDVCRYVSGKRKELTKNCLSIIIRDIETEMKICRAFGKTLGMECDEKQWIRLLELLKTERNGRNED